MTSILPLKFALHKSLLEMEMSLGSIETPFQLAPMSFNNLNGVSTDTTGSVSIDYIHSRRFVCDVNAKGNKMEGRFLADVEAMIHGIL